VAPRLRVTVDGPARAPALLLANPLGTTVEVWDAQVGPFGEHFRVIRYEPAPRASVVDLAADMVSILDQHGLERVSICGLSLGARLVVLEGAAHLANVERAAAFNTAVLDHLIPGPGAV
jgi:pimeloyl-ACP methyl ester carboxylesterase